MAKFHAFVTLTLTLDRVILHTVMHHSSLIPNFIEIEETICGRADGHLRPTLLGRLGGVDLNTNCFCIITTRLSVSPGSAEALVR